jgi:Patatin-like phospholipase
MFEWVKHALGRALTKTRQFFKPATDRVKRFASRFTETKIKLSYFDEVLAVELHAINTRRRKIAERGELAYRPIRKFTPSEPYTVVRLDPQSKTADDDNFPTEKKALPSVQRPKSPDLPPPAEHPSMTVPPKKPDPQRTRPQPIPTTSVGLALSGGGIRSAAFCLGALQALDFFGITDKIDYLSTVSGGGYMGACLTASMSQNGGRFPFGDEDADVRDNDVVGHIRNYSNYLMPRARSGLRNILDVVAILLRGLLANALIVFTFLLAAAFITCIAYPNWGDLQKGSFVARLIVAQPAWLRLVFNKLWNLLVPGWLGGPLSRMGAWLGSHLHDGLSWIGSLIGLWMPSQIIALYNFIIQFAGSQFFVTALMAAATAAILIYWALRRSLSDADSNDVNSWVLAIARVVLALTVLSAILDLQPSFISWLGAMSNFKLLPALASLSPIIGAAVTVALFARKLGAFLKTTEIVTARSVRIQRIVTQAALIAAGLVLPFVLFVFYWLLAAWLIEGGPVPKPIDVADARFYGAFLLLILIGIMWAFEANAYSLHQFYKDRLSKAFLFRPVFNGRVDPPSMRKFKLSHIRSADCPYHIINAALNVQGSTKANRRGRNADFFTFTRDFVGSDLTFFAPTSLRTTTNDMETVDSKLDLGAAMAISGAALSANMGSNTVRWLSPTLALLNIRLGYWLRNPLDLARQKKFIRPREALYNFISKFYLFLEMFNVLDENDRFVYLTDGGHIENLGIYQLLKRGCRLIIAIDAEADPNISCASLLKLERYARIDLGIRIVLPWEQIRERYRETSTAIDPKTPQEARRIHGPHCALGRIFYEDGSYGILLYFKSSMTGDEKDYLIDYKKRNPSFPHETTGDQFFGEEQFEVYRALGYHVVDGYFSGADEISWQRLGQGAWLSIDAARAEVNDALHHM